MKALNGLIALTGLAISATLLGTPPQHASAHGNDKHIQNVSVRVDGSGYHPAKISVKAGRPVHLSFVSKGDGCANAVRIPSLNKSFKITPGQKKEVVFTLKKGQTVAFACGMNMFKGKVVGR